MRAMLAALSLLAAPAAGAQGHAFVHVGSPGLAIGLSFPVAPRLVSVPGLPVLYAPQVAANFFFHGGLYWTFADGGWYSSPRHDGSWHQVEPWDVPPAVLNVPVGYYRRPPPSFAAWRADRAPRWDDHWGRDWRRHGREDGLRSSGGDRRGRGHGWEDVRHGGRHAERDDRWDDRRGGGRDGHGGRGQGQGQGQGRGGRDDGHGRRGERGYERG